MKTINRYIIWELLQSFFFALLAMTVLLIIGGLVREALQKNVPLTQIVQLVPFVMVNMAPISIPMTLLLAVTTFFAKISGNNEIVALKSLGIPPWAILWPAMVFGILLSFFTVWLNEMSITWGRTGMAAVIYSAAEDIILNQLKTTHSFATESGDLKIVVKGVEDRRLISPIITLKSQSATIEAKSARLQIDFTEQLLTISLENVVVSSDGKASYSSAERTLTFPLNNIVSKGDEYTRAADTPLWNIPKVVDEYNDNMIAFKRNAAARRAFAVGLGAVDTWNESAVAQLKLRAVNESKLAERLLVEPPRRWATGFSCFFFIWLGAPLAIWMRKSDIFSSFFACFMPILLLYYPLLMYGMQGAKRGWLPPESVWIANIGLGLIGIWFLRHIHRY